MVAFGHSLWSSAIIFASNQRLHGLLRNRKPQIAYWMRRVAMRRNVGLHSFEYGLMNLWLLDVHLVAGLSRQSYVA